MRLLSHPLRIQIALQNERRRNRIYIFTPGNQPKIKKKRSIPGTLFAFMRLLSHPLRIQIALQNERRRNRIYIFTMLLGLFACLMQNLVRFHRRPTLIP